MIWGKRAKGTATQTEMSEYERLQKIFQTYGSRFKQKFTNRRGDVFEVMIFKHII